MSKLWLLLLFVAAFQFIHAHPANDELIGVAETEVLEFDEDEYVIGDEQWIDDLDEERASEKTKQFMEKMKQKLKKLKGKIVEAIKDGAKMIKELGIKVNALQCEGKSCKSCVSMNLGTKTKNLCIQLKLVRTNKATYLDVTFGSETKKYFEQKVRLGDLPRCLNVGGFVGKICLKGIEGRAKTSKGEPQVNFCLGVLAEKHGFGVKFCAKYINKKFNVDFEPELFAGAMDDETGEMVKQDGDQNTLALDADEFEIEEE